MAKEVGGGFEPPLLFGIDVGTQTTRVLAFDVAGRHVHTASCPTPVRPLGEGRAEYDPEDLWKTVQTCLARTIAAIPAGAPVAGMAVASVGEACVLVDGADRALAPALVWHDRRTVAEAAAIEKHLGRDRLFEITGQVADSIYGLCKVLWMRRNWPEAFGRAMRLLNIADWIAFRLSGVAATDFTLASRMLALDVHGRCWSHEILESFDVPAQLYAPLRASGTPLGPMRRTVADALGLTRPPVIAVGGHDHLCGMFAAGAVRPGILLDSLGTAEALLCAVPEPLRDRAVLACGYMQGCIQADRPLAYVGAGLHASGGAVEWFRTALAGGTARADLIETARAVPAGSRGVLFLPHLAFAPPPTPDVRARGAFVGLTMEADRGTMFRALLEGLAFEARRMLEGMTGLAGLAEPEEVRIIGGNSRNRLLLSIKSSVLGRPLVVIDEAEATALGAALMGGLGAGLWPNLDAALGTIAQPRHVVMPEPHWTETYDRLYREVYGNLYPALIDVNHRIDSCG